MGGEDLGKVACLPTTGKNAIYERREFFLGEYSCLFSGNRDGKLE